MISNRLLSSLVCTSRECHGSQSTAPKLEQVGQAQLRCPRCGALYPLMDGYADLMPASTGEHRSLYVSLEEEFAHMLDYRRVGPPLLAAGVRQRALRRLLRPRRDDRLVELGCGNGKFLVWNRSQVAWLVGVDPAPLFADEALSLVDLCRADGRRLPFTDGTFTAALSIDVLEHLPLADLEQYLSEARRVLAPSGRLFVFSNTREGSRLDFVVRSARLLSRWLASRGVIDDARDRLRKSDHVKAIATYPELQQLMERCGFQVEQVLYWNGLFQSLIENLLVKLVESAMRKFSAVGRAASGSPQQPDAGEDRIRGSMRTRLRQHGMVYTLMRLLTNLMWLDIRLFGRWRAGPYFLLASRVDNR